MPVKQALPLNGDRGAAVFGGDLVVSGNMRIVGTVSGGSPVKIDGGLLLTGSGGLTIESDAGSVHHLTGGLHVTGSAHVTGSMSIVHGLEVNKIRDTSAGPGGGDPGQARAG